MYLWRRLASREWLIQNQSVLESRAGAKLAIIEQLGRKRIQVEFVCKTRAEASKFCREFGGRVEKLPRDWLTRFALKQKSKPLKIGKRLLIVDSLGKREANGFPYRTRSGGFQTAGAIWKSPFLVIPAGLAFGTGEHATTAMSLRMLERVIRFWGAHAPSRAALRASRNASRVRKSFRRGAENDTRGRVRSPDLVVDIGTGTGILALAARALGTKRVIGLDFDPIAISTARKNARLNKLDHVEFQLADVRGWRPPRQIDIVTANLFSELLIEILPKLKKSRRLILSGVMRAQERELRRALRANRIEIVQVRRRGKWIALLAQKRI